MRIGIITDIHENVRALDHAFSLAEKHKVDGLACLGDIVGYDTRFYNHSARSAGECVRMVRSACRWVVAGNHDLHAARRLPLYSNGFAYPADWFSMSSQDRKRMSSGKVWCYESEAHNDLNPDESEYLQEIPEFLISGKENTKILFSHYVCPDFTGSTTRYAEYNSQMEKHWDFMRQNNLNVSFIGHSHNHFAGFAFRNRIPFLHAFHSLHNNNFHLDDEPVVVMLPPLSGEKGKTGFSIFDSETMSLIVLTTTE